MAEAKVSGAAAPPTLRWKSWWDGWGGRWKSWWNGMEEVGLAEAKDGDWNGRSRNGDGREGMRRELGYGEVWGQYPLEVG